MSLFILTVCAKQFFANYRQLCNTRTQQKDVVCNSEMSTIMGVIILYAYAYYHSVLERLHAVHFQEMHCADAHYLQIDMSLSAFLTTGLFCHKKTSFFVYK